jgi:FAD/FMN-containing dehydrogenase
MSLTDTLAGIVGAAHVITDPDVLDGRSVDHTGRYRGHASMLVRPGSAEEAAGAERLPRRGCHRAGRPDIGRGPCPNTTAAVDRAAAESVRSMRRAAHPRRAGATLAEVQRAAARVWCSGSTSRRAIQRLWVGWRRRTPADCTVRYGNMGEQILGLMWRCPTGRWCTGTEVRRDNTGYDLASLFVGAEGAGRVTLDPAAATRRTGHRDAGSAPRRAGRNRRRSGKGTASRRCS